MTFCWCHYSVWSNCYIYLSNLIMEFGVRGLLYRSDDKILPLRSPLLLHHLLFIILDEFPKTSFYIFSQSLDQAFLRAFLMVFSRRSWLAGRYTLLLPALILIHKPVFSVITHGRLHNFVTSTSASFHQDNLSFSLVVFDSTLWI